MRVAVTPNGPYAYVTNNGSGTISSYAVQKYAKLTLAQAVTATSGPGRLMQPSLALGDTCSY